MKTRTGYDIWENEYYIPMGFSYDYYVTRSQYESLAETQRELLMLKAIVLEDEDAAQYAGSLEHITDPSTLTYTEDAYLQDCLDRRETSCASFSRDNGGFSAPQRAVKNGWCSSASPMRMVGAPRSTGSLRKSSRSMWASWR